MRPEPQPTVATMQHPVLRLATLVAVATFLGDWASKSWALHTLDGTMPLGSLLLAVERNEAFAFSAGEGVVPTFVVIAVRLCALMALVALSRSIVLVSRRYAAGLGLVLGGGIGNAADVLFREGGVIDFIGAGPFSFSWVGETVHFHLVFNLADLAVIVGIGLLAPLIRAWALMLQRRVARWEADLLDA